MDNGFKYIIDNGIATEADYSYTAATGTCKKVNRTKPMTQFKDITPKSSAAMKAALAKGPVSVAIDAAGIGFQLYHGGVYNPTLFKCGTSLDHGVLAVGYGTSTDNKPYYIVKNSWGASWGEKGYIRMADNSPTGAGMCGIQLQASMPTA